MGPKFIDGGTGIGATKFKEITDALKQVPVINSATNSYETDTFITLIKAKFGEIYVAPGIGGNKPNERWTALHKIITEQGIKVKKEELNQKYFTEISAEIFANLKIRNFAIYTLNNFKTNPSNNSVELIKVQAAFNYLRSAKISDQALARIATILDTFTISDASQFIADEKSANIFIQKYTSVPAATGPSSVAVPPSTSSVATPRPPSAGQVPTRAAILDKFNAYNVAINPKEPIHIPGFLLPDKGEPKTTPDRIGASIDSIKVIKRLIRDASDTVKSQTNITRKNLQDKITNYRKNHYTGYEQLIDLDLDHEPGTVGGKRKRSKKIGTKKKQYKRK